jgi:methionyl-tRNA formyltransferase
MRAGFAGTPEFAARALAAIHAAGHTIPIVLTQPDRPSGRGMALTASTVKRKAAALGLSVLQPVTLRTAEAQATLFGTELDVLVVAAYGLILPQAVLDWPRHGCLNIHASLLPRWRGAAPIARAIEAGDAVTGITIMQMDAGLDTGPIVCREEVAIGPRDTAGTLHDRLADAGARLVVETLAVLARDGALATTAQPAQGATYAGKIERRDRPIDWNASAMAIDRRVRALSPAPGAMASWRGTAVTVRTAELVGEARIEDRGSRIEGRGASSEDLGSRSEGAAADTAPRQDEAARGADVAPGTVVALAGDGLDVCCGDGKLLRLTELQPAGGRPMSGRAFAAGRGIGFGSRFDRTSSSDGTVGGPP